MSKLKLGWKVVTGFLNPWGSVAGNVADYVLGLLNDALAKIDPARKEQIQAALNVAKKVAATLSAMSWLCPTKWQTAYGKTIVAVREVVYGLEDLQITPGELTDVRIKFAAAVSAWRGDDDETCVECIAS